MNYILDLDIEDFIGLYIETVIKKQEDRLFKEWVVQVPYMDKNTYIPFSSYLDSCKNNSNNYDIANEEEVLKEMEEVLKQFER